MLPFWLRDFQSRLRLHFASISISKNPPSLTFSLSLWEIVSRPGDFSSMFHITFSFYTICFNVHVTDSDVWLHLSKIFALFSLWQLDGLQRPEFTYNNLMNQTSDLRTSSKREKEKLEFRNGVHRSFMFQLFHVRFYLLCLPSL